MGSSVDRTQLRKKKKISELKDQYKFLKLKAKEKKGKRTKYPRTVEQL